MFSSPFQLRQEPSRPKLAVPSLRGIRSWAQPGENTLQIEVPNHYATEVKPSEPITKEFGLPNEKTAAAHKSRPSGLLGSVEVRPHALLHVESR